MLSNLKAGKNFALSLILEKKNGNQFTAMGLRAKASETQGFRRQTWYSSVSQLTLASYLATKQSQSWSSLYNLRPKEISLLWGR